MAYISTTKIKNRITTIEDTLASAEGIGADIDALALKQDALVSGANIKTINSQNVLGTGNIIVNDVSAENFSYGQSYMFNLQQSFNGNENVVNNVGAKIGRLRDKGIKPVFHFSPFATRYQSLPVVSKNRSLDFSVSRNCEATYRDEDQVLQTALPDMARIDFSDGEGVLLTEPQSTNLIPYSNDFNNSWYDKRNTFILPNEILSPKTGVFADKIVEDTSNDVHSIRRFTLTPANVSTYTYSIYAKCDSSKRDLNIFIELDNYTRNADVLFDLDNGVVISESGTGLIKSDIISLENDWFRCIVTFDTTLGDIKSIKNRLNNNGSNTYVGDGTSGIYIWGGQVENLTYATSIIETAGTAITRTADVVGGAGNTSTFNSSEGVLYAEIAKLDVNADEGSVFLSKDSDNEIRLNLAQNNRLNLYVNVGGVNQIYGDNSSFALSDYNKIAVKYKLNDYSVYINGTEVYTNTSALVPSNLDELKFNNFHGKTKQIQVFDTALTDAELITLTTL